MCAAPSRRLFLARWQIWMRRRHRRPAPSLHTQILTRRRCRCAGIEDLREKREEVNKSIAADEEEKAKIQNDLRILTERLSRLNDNLARKIASRNEYDKTIQETEAAYAKIMESSQTLLHVLKRESVNLTKKKQASS